MGYVCLYIDDINKVYIIKGTEQTQSTSKYTHFTQ